MSLNHKKFSIQTSKYLYHNFYSKNSRYLMKIHELCSVFSGKRYDIILILKYIMNSFLFMFIMYKLCFLYFFNIEKGKWDYFIKNFAYNSKKYWDSNFSLKFTHFADDLRLVRFFSPDKKHDKMMILKYVTKWGVLFFCCCSLY